MMSGHVLEAFLSGDWRSVISAGLGALSDGAKKAFDDLLNKFNPSKEFKDDYKKWFKDQFDQWMPDPDQFHRIEDDINRLLKDVQNEAKDVFGSINQTVQNALGSGQIPPQTDGGLGQTHDDFTPQGDVPFNVGTLPGMGTDAAGISRSPGAGDGGSGSGSSGTAPLGGSGASSGSQSGSTGSSGSAQPPSAADLGIDPNSGAFIEYQPSLNQVVVTYPDGSTETIPWPPQ